jgi:hypothetical protein
VTFFRLADQRISKQDAGATHLALGSSLRATTTQA